MNGELRFGEFSVCRAMWEYELDRADYGVLCQELKQKEKCVFVFANVFLKFAL